MEKIDSGSALACGHTQVISELRTKIAKQGLVQPDIWCVECTAWTQVVPDPEETDGNQA